MINSWPAERAAHLALGPVVSHGARRFDHDCFAAKSGKGVPEGPVLGFQPHDGGWRQYAAILARFFEHACEGCGGPRMIVGDLQDGTTRMALQSLIDLGLETWFLGY